MTVRTGSVPEHDVVLATLYDLQARLRGDPATLVQPRGQVHLEDDEVVTIPDAIGQDPDDLADAAARVAALQARLAELEHELGSVVARLRPGTDAPLGHAVADATVVDLQRVIDRRLRDA